jgi:TFIIF-interacting CTD phosphatase-like protein
VTSVFIQKYKDLDPARAAVELKKAFEDSVDEVFLSSNPDLTTMLPNIRPPFLPPKKPEDRQYTLVLDLDETLVHYSDAKNVGKFLIRPGARAFLEQMVQYYEIVVFTAAM